MKIRVLTAIVAIALFIPLLFVLPTIYITIVFGLFCALGVWELLYATKSVEKHIFLYASCFAAFFVPFAVSSVSSGIWPLLVIVTCYMIFAFACAVFDHTKITYAALSKGFLATIILPIMFSAVLRILNVPQLGVYIVLMPWITVWVCDSVALFVGKAFGKKKLAPYVSPKKTVAGAIGGLIGGVVAMGAYALVLRHYFAIDISLSLSLLFGLLGAAAGQLGDLSLSVIKRESKIKDYGKIFPGHGGVWDRFDSILFAAPLFEIIFLHLTQII